MTAIPEAYARDLKALSKDELAMIVWAMATRLAGEDRAQALWVWDEVRATRREIDQGHPNPPMTNLTTGQRIAPVPVPPQPPARDEQPTPPARDEQPTPPRTVAVPPPAAPGELFPTTKPGHAQ